MSVTINLPADVLARLRAEAARRGVSLDELIAELAGQLPTHDTGETTGPSPHRLAFVAAGASRDGITTRLEQTLADGFGRD